ncbi:MAG: cupin domain-containing protein [Alphaproteobacteria bacterium]|nr:cupin domain-containing protein [Alphaproteobacteria bacterium]
MLSQTLAAGLESYRIGPKIRALRVKKNLGLVQLGEHTGMSSGMLSKIERGQLFPTLPTLLKIAMVFGVGLEHFFVDLKVEPTVAVVRKKDRLRLPDRPGAENPSFFFESLDYPVSDRKMEAYYTEFEPQSGATEPHKHSGAEIIYVINGQLAVNVDGEDTLLAEGDSMYFDCAFPHSYRRQGRGTCSAIVVVTG